VATSAARHKTSALIRRNQNAMAEDTRRFAVADFRLRGALGMVARVRHTV